MKLSELAVGKRARILQVNGEGVTVGEGTGAEEENGLLPELR